MNNFIDENEAEGISKSEILAQRILTRIHVHDYDSGGVFSFITGGMGTGKTSTMLSFADYTLKHCSGEKIFWSNTYFAPIQSLKIGLKKHNLMVLKDGKVTFHDRVNKLQQIHPEVTHFDDYDDLYQKAKSGKVNAVFFGERYKWIDFIHYLRSCGEWCHVYLDELSEICPSFSSGKLFKLIGKFSVDLKECRKCMLSIHANSQALPDIDHRIRTKIMVRIFLAGARTDQYSRVEQKAIDNLEENPIEGNEAYVEQSGRFGLTRFADIYKPNRSLSWEARVDG
jgi:hypothetical protein